MTDKALSAEQEQEQMTMHEAGAELPRLVRYE